MICEGRELSPGEEFKMTIDYRKAYIKNNVIMV